MPSRTATTPWLMDSGSGDPMIDALLFGNAYVRMDGSAATTLTFSFPTSNSTAFWSTASKESGGYGPTNGDAFPWTGFAALDAGEQQAVRSALGAWAAVAEIAFNEVAETTTNVGTLRFAHSTSADFIDFDALAYFPKAGPHAGDVWFNANSPGLAGAWSQGSAGYWTALHEIGHAIGLKHPFEDTPQLPANLDSRAYTVMSYSALNGDRSTTFSFEPTTPMVLDIDAIQHLYGPNTTIASGNSSYVFSAGGTYHRTIWDAGGIDTIRYASATGGIIELRSGLVQGSLLGQAVNALASNGTVIERTWNIYIANGTTIENATGGAGGDTINGNAVGNLLRGEGGNDSLAAGAGDDTLYGGTGNDTLIGSTGSDQMFGGAGNDLYRADASDDFEESGTDAGGIDTVYGTFNVALGSGIENIELGGSGSYSATGNTLANTIYGNGGANLLDGNSGNDTLYGYAGNDTLDGRSGVDVMFGGEGSDTYRVYDVGDMTEETGTGAGNVDTVVAFLDWTLGIGLENLTLAGILPMNGTGNAQANRLEGNLAANTLDGKAGADVMVGGSGNDIYRVDHANDSVVETGGSAAEVDQVFAAVSHTLDDWVENLTLTGTAAQGTGNGLANRIIGNAAANTLTGNAGNDVLLGGAGNDALIGSTGRDTMEGGTGNDTYYVDIAGDVVRETSAAVGESDLVVTGFSYTLGANLERLSLVGTGIASGTGNALANSLAGNSAANVLNGKAGNDSLTGRAGADTFVFDSRTGADTVTDFATGIDKLRVAMAGIRIGDGDVVIDGALARAAPGGFAPTAELVVFSANAGSLTLQAAASAIGSATSAYATGRTALFAVDNGTSTGLFLFTAGGPDALVSAIELQIVATLTGAATTALSDYVFVA